MLNPYESSRLLAEYLLFHYGSEEQSLRERPGPREALDFPVRCVHELVDPGRVPAAARALDVGCAVGRSSFELCAFCPTVIGIDFSHSFIQAARELKDRGEFSFEMVVEGEICELARARVPANLDRRRAHFEVGDATHLPGDLGTFDVVLCSGLIYHVPSPMSLLLRLAKVTGEMLVIESASTTKGGDDHEHLAGLVVTPATCFSRRSWSSPPELSRTRERSSSQTATPAAVRSPSLSVRPATLPSGAGR